MFKTAFECHILNQNDYGMSFEIGKHWPYRHLGNVAMGGSDKQHINEQGAKLISEVLRPRPSLHLHPILINYSNIGLCHH
jgi:hypothetical protein